MILQVEGPSRLHHHHDPTEKIVTAQTRSKELSPRKSHQATWKTMGCVSNLGNQRVVSTRKGLGKSKSQEGKEMLPNQISAIVYQQIN